MTIRNDITELKVEFAKLAGSMLYLSSMFSPEDPEHYPFYVFSSHCLNLVDRLDIVISSMGLDDEIIH